MSTEGSPYAKAIRLKWRLYGIVISAVFALGVLTAVFEEQLARSRALNVAVLVSAISILWLILVPYTLIVLGRAACPRCGWGLYFDKNEHGQPISKSSWGWSISKTCPNCGLDLTRPG